jgi:hypothetical protein
LRKLLLVPVLMLFARPAAAQDVEAMAKWTAYQIVHYKIVGEFSGETILMKGSGQKVPTTIQAQVTDRIEIEFDWDQQEFNIVGKPVIRNFPTKVGSIIFPQLGANLSSKNCPALKLNGALEFLTGMTLRTDDATRMSGIVTLELRRDQPGGSYPAFGDTDTCGEIWETSKAVSETSTLSLMAVPGMYLVMPIPANQGMKISADKKSIILTADRPGASGYGWTWTVTPTGVK